jgi:5'-nucleotidase
VNDNDPIEPRGATGQPSAEPCVGRVLLTNDDGIAAPGLAVLEEVAASLAGEVWVVAPEQDQSGTSHSITLHSPLRISPQGERRFAVFGTPGDCVAMALRHIMLNAPPDLILSGINRGANLGVETVFSGTVGAAMTGMLLGVPSIALSQMFSKRDEVPWDTSRRFAAGVVRRLLAAGWQADACLNVNFPPVPADQAGPLTVTRQGPGLIGSIDVIARTDPRGKDYHWLQFRRSNLPNPPDSEAAMVAAGRITVTPLQFERTNDEALSSLAAALAPD